MKLERADAELFYQLWFSLMQFANKKHHIRPKLGALALGQNIDVNDAKAVADYIWSHTEIIDAYLSATKLPEEHAQIVAGWKHRRQGEYILERHLKKGSVFICTEDFSVYMVQGLFSTWEEVLKGFPVPTIIETVLLPFRGSIITDGLIKHTCIRFGKSMREDVKAVYMDAKRNHEIQFSLECE